MARVTVSIGQRWAALLASCVVAYARTDVFLASDRTVAPVATLNSVCDGAAAPSQLRLHVVAPTKADALEIVDATAHACGEATFVAMGLPELETAIREELGVEPMWTTALSRVRRFERSSEYAVPVARWDSDGKHSSPFNHARFYYPELMKQRYRKARRLVMLDDDVIVRGDVATLAVAGDAAMAAGCQSWYIDGDQLQSSTELSYLEVPFFGFGTLGASRSPEDAACAGGGRECVPVVDGSPLGFFAKLGRVEHLVDAVGAWSWPLRSAAALADRAAEAAAGDARGAGAKFLESLGSSRAWNFGLVVVDVDAWHESALTAKYERWLEANARDEIWPSDSLAFGLGLPFLALRGSVECSDLEAAFALHWNGNRKPWDPALCDNATRPTFLAALARSPELLAAHVAGNGTFCEAAALEEERRLYGQASVAGTRWSSYAEAYLWAENHYAVSGVSTSSIDECYDVCQSMFPGANGTLACPTTDLELELLRDIAWEPAGYGWLGLYREAGDATFGRCASTGASSSELQPSSSGLKLEQKRKSMVSIVGVCIAANRRPCLTTSHERGLTERRLPARRSTGAVDVGVVCSEIVLSAAQFFNPGHSKFVFRSGIFNFDR